MNSQPCGTKSHQHRYLIIPYQKGVGDQLVCSSLIRNLAQNRPNAEIDILVFNKLGKELYQLNPFVRMVHEVEMARLDQVSFRNPLSFSDRIRFVRSFRRMRYDIVYILGINMRFVLFAWLIGAKRRIGHTAYHGVARLFRNLLLTDIVESSSRKNIAERFLDLLALDGMHVSDAYSEIYLSQEELSFAERLLASRGVSHGERVLVLAPFSADMRRAWPTDRFLRIAEYFADKGYKVLILGTTSERDRIKNARELQHKNIIDLMGNLSIRETAAVIKQSTGFLGNDSGLGHVAGAVRTRALILGYFVTTYWYPLSPSVETMIKETGCTTCSLKELKKCFSLGAGVPNCVDSIRVDEVIAAMEKMMPSATSDSEIIARTCELPHDR